MENKIISADQNVFVVHGSYDGQLFIKGVFLEINDAREALFDDIFFTDNIDPRNKEEWKEFERSREDEEFCNFDVTNGRSLYYYRDPDTNHPYEMEVERVQLG